MHDAMPTVPTITLQPGGERPPSPTQKVNILAALGAAAAAHTHSTGEVAGLDAALASLVAAIGAVPAHNLPGFNTAAERRLESTYAGLGITPMPGLMVRQLDLSLLCILLTSDVTNDANWIALPYTTDPDGVLIVSMVLADVADTVPDLGTIGRLGSVPTVGDSGRTGGRLLLTEDVLPSLTSQPTACFSHTLSDAHYAKAVKIVFTGAVAPLIYVKAVNGATHARLLRWDGTYAVDEPLTSSPHPITSNDWDTAPASPYNNRLPKFCAILPCDSGGNIVGDISYVWVADSNVTAVEVSGLAELEEFRITSSRITSLGLRDLPKLTVFSVSGSPIGDVDFTGVRDTIETILFSSCSCIRSLSIVDAPVLDRVTVSGCDTFRSLMVSSAASLDTIEVQSCPEFTSFRAAGNFAALSTLKLCGGDPDLSIFPNLTDLYFLSDTTTLTDFSPTLATLTHLTLGYHPDMTTVDASGLPALLYCTLIAMPSLVSSVLPASTIALEVTSSPLLTTITLPVGSSVTTYRVTSCDSYTGFDKATIPAAQTVDITACGAIAAADFSGLVDLAAFYLINCTALSSVTFGGHTEIFNFSVSGCTAVTSVIASGAFTGAYYGGFSSGFGMDLAGAGLDADGLWAMLNSFGVAAPGTNYLLLTGCAADANDGPPPSILPGATYDQTDIETLLTSKDYGLILTDGILLP